MALPSISARTPTTVRAVVVTLTSTLISDEVGGELTTEEKKASYALNILDQDGVQMPPAAGNLIPHLTQEQLDWLIPFMDAMRALAEAALPSPS